MHTEGFILLCCVAAGKKWPSDDERKRNSAADKEERDGERDYVEVHRHKTEKSDITTWK